MEPSWQKSLFIKPSPNSPGSESHFSLSSVKDTLSWLNFCTEPIVLTILIAVLSTQGRDSCYGSANPKCGKGDRPERGNGDDRHRINI